jgi:hypothetical protein
VSGKSPLPNLCDPETFGLAEQDVDAARCHEHQGRTIHHPVSAATASILRTVGSSWLESPPWIWGSWQREQAEVGPPQAWFWSSCHCCGCYINSLITNITELRGSEWKHARHIFGPHIHPSYLPFPHSYICSETTLTGKSRFHISPPRWFEPVFLVAGSKQVVHWTSETWWESCEIAGSPHIKLSPLCTSIQLFYY